MRSRRAGDPVRREDHRRPVDAAVGPDEAGRQVRHERVAARELEERELSERPA